MNSYAFISYSTADKNIAENLAELLGEDNIFVDFWDLDLGDVLPQKIAEAIHFSKYFIIIASINSMKSRWIAFELNIALTKWIQESDYRIIIFRIDNCEIPPELSSFLRINCSDDLNQEMKKLGKVIASEEAKKSIPLKGRRRRIINRFNEIATIEQLFHEGIRFIYLWGMYGIGKTTIVERAAHEIYNLPLCRIPLTEAHGPLRLSLELCSKSKSILPSALASENELTMASVDSILKLIDQGNVILFDDLENSLEDNGILRPFLSSLFEELIKREPLLIPILCSSTRYPKINALPIEIQQVTHIMNISRMSDNDLLYCLENWLTLTQPGKAIPEREKLKEVIPNLFGYPLAARLASYYIVKYSVDFLLKDVSYFKHIRIDIAKQLLGRIKAQFTSIEINCLEALAVAETGASMSELANAIQSPINETRFAIDTLASALIIFSENGRLQIDPIVKDFFWARVYEKRRWREYALRLGREAKNRLSVLDPQSESFIHYCSKAYRLLAISGKLSETQNLKYGFKDELRDVSRRLYHAGDFKLAFEYINLCLDINADDRDMRWLKARILTKHSKFNEAETEFFRLKKDKYRPHKLDYGWGLLRREQGRLEEAVIFFRNGLKGRSDDLPLLRDLGDVLFRLGDNIGAINVLKRAFDLAPRDITVITKYVDILEKIGDFEQALSIVEGAIGAFPDDLFFEQHMSRILEKLGRFNKALYHARNYMKMQLSPSPQSILLVAKLSLRNNNIDDAINVIETLPEKLSKHDLRIKNIIIAEIKLLKGDFENARACLSDHEPFSNPNSAYVLSRIEIEDASRALALGKFQIARDHFGRAKGIIEVALSNFPNDSYLINVKNKLDRLEKEFS